MTDEQKQKQRVAALEVADRVRSRRSAIVITFRQAADAGACQGGVDRMREHLGRDWPDGEAFPLVTVLDVSGVDDALWGLGVVDRVAARLVASDFAAHVAYLNADPRVAAAVRAARDYANGEIDAAAWVAANAAAWAAASDAARAAASAAAWAARAAASAAASTAAARAAASAAAGDVERAWQARHLRAVLTGEKQPGRTRIRKGARQ